MLKKWLPMFRLRTTTSRHANGISMRFDNVSGPSVVVVAEAACADVVAGTTRGLDDTQDLLLADGRPTEVLPRTVEWTLTYRVVGAEEDETLGEAEADLSPDPHPVPGRRHHLDHVGLIVLFHRPDQSPNLHLPYETHPQHHEDGKSQELGLKPSHISYKELRSGEGLLNHPVIDAQDLQQALKCHAHARLEDDEKEATPHLIAVELQAQSGAATAETAHFHPHDHGRARQTDGGTLGGVTDIAENLHQATPLMTIESTSRLIFSRDAMHTMIVV